MGTSPESPSTLSPPPHLYPEELQLKLYQAFIFSIPILFSIILFLLFYLFYLKRSSPSSYSPATIPTIPPPWTLNQATSSAPAHFDADLKLEGDLKSKLSTVFFDDHLKTKDSLCCVCLGEFQMKEELLQVPACKHVFHMECIRHWFLHSSSTTCPLCRASISLAAACNDPQPSTFHPNPLVVVHHQH